MTGQYSIVGTAPSPAPVVFVGGYINEPGWEHTGYSWDTNTWMKITNQAAIAAENALTNYTGFMLSSNGTAINGTFNGWFDPETHQGSAGLAVNGAGPFPAAEFNGVVDIGYLAIEGNSISSYYGGLDLLDDTGTGLHLDGGYATFDSTAIFGNSIDDGDFVQSIDPSARELFINVSGISTETLSWQSRMLYAGPGTINSLDWQNLILYGNWTVAGTLSGDAYGLTNIQSTNIIGQIPSSLLTDTVSKSVVTNAFFYGTAGDASGYYNFDIGTSGYNVVALSAVSDPGNHWNSTGNYWTVPVSGTYRIVVKLRLADTTDVGAQCEIGAGDPSSFGDTPDGLWFTFVLGNSASNRTTALDDIAQHFNAGDKIGMYAAPDDNGNDMGGNNATMTINLLFSDQ